MAEDLSRREFVSLSVAAGIAAAAGSADAADVIVENDVEIKTPDGVCDAAFIHPASGTHAAVIIWPDAFGLRPTMRGFARQLAEAGYSVLVPNPFYRISKAPQFGDISNFSFSNPADRSKLTPLMGSITASGAAEKDAGAFVAWLDSQPTVSKTKKIGTQGYCMGGPLVFRTLASQPARVGAGGSFHGGGLVTASPESPHLMIPKMKAKLYVGIASNDDKSQPDAKDKLRDAFKAANVTAEIEVYESLHGWCVPDMPNATPPIYNKPEAEKAWGKLIALYKAALA
jgi:carboxymethylenebutenolidase